MDYLKSVESPEGEEVPNYHSQVVKSGEEVKNAVLSAYPGADLSSDPSGWFGTPAVNEGGTVSSILVGGVTLTGGQVRTCLTCARPALPWLGWDQLHLFRHRIRPRGGHEPVAGPTPWPRRGVPTMRV